MAGAIRKTTAGSPVAWQATFHVPAMCPDHVPDHVPAGAPRAEIHVRLKAAKPLPAGRAADCGADLPANGTGGLDRGNGQRTGL